MTETETNTETELNVSETLEMVFQADDQIAQLKQARGGALQSLYKAGQRGPYGTSRGVCRVGLVSTGKPKAGKPPSRVELKFQTEVKTTELAI